MQDQLDFEKEDDLNKTIIEERNKDLKQIENDAIVLSETMNLLAEQVNDQGYHVDNILAHIENAAENTKEASDDLGKAENYSIRSRFWKGVLVIGGIVVAGSVTTLAYLKRR